MNQTPSHPAPPAPTWNLPAPPVGPLRPVVALPVAIPAWVVPYHAFTLGKRVVVHVQPRGVGIVDEAGGVLWEASRDQVELSGAGTPGLLNLLQSTTIRTPGGRRQYVVFTDPRWVTYLLVSVLALVAMLSLLVGAFVAAPLAAFAVARIILMNRQSTPGIRQFLIDAILTGRR